uniref:GNAT family N-acetyltransferase n=1 Tax=Candidatus Enterococcus willemsii TaxID=1857215 RepID=UPI00403FA587
MIRFATKEDAEAIAKLVLVILKDMELPFVQQVGDQETVAILAEAVNDPTYRYGYQRGLVNEIDGQVAGVAFGYPSEDEPQIDEAFSRVLLARGMEDQRLFLDPETFPDEWYLDTICVDEKFRGQGVGSELLDALPTIAQREGKHRIGLCVDLANPNAQRLYERKGFVVVGQQVLSGHDYYHMQKKI